MTTHDGAGQRTGFFNITSVKGSREVLSLPSNSLVDDTPSQRSSGEVKVKKMKVCLDRNFMARVPENVIQHSMELKLRKKVAGEEETIALLVNAIDVLLDQ